MMELKTIAASDGVDAIEDWGGYLGMLDLSHPTELLKEGKL